MSGRREIAGLPWIHLEIPPTRRVCLLRARRNHSLLHNHGRILRSRLLDNHRFLHCPNVQIALHSRTTSVSIKFEKTQKCSFESVGSGFLRFSCNSSVRKFQFLASAVAIIPPVGCGFLLFLEFRHVQGISPLISEVLIILISEYLDHARSLLMSRSSQLSRHDSDIPALSELREECSLVPKWQTTFELEAPEMIKLERWLIHWKQED